MKTLISPTRHVVQKINARHLFIPGLGLGQDSRISRNFQTHLRVSFLFQLVRMTERSKEGYRTNSKWKLY